MTRVHGRTRRPLRSVVVGPRVARKRRRSDSFVETVEAMMDHLRKIAPEELRNTAVKIHPMPDGAAASDAVPRWRVDTASNTIHLFRLPIERLGHHHPEDRWYERMLVESAVIKAAAELIGWDPWQLTPGREAWE